MSQVLEPSAYQNVSTTVKLNGKDVKIHALCTGMVAVKTAFRARYLDRARRFGWQVVSLIWNTIVSFW